MLHTDRTNCGASLMGGSPDVQGRDVAEVRVYGQQRKATYSDLQPFQRGFCQQRSLIVQLRHCGAKTQ